MAHLVLDTTLATDVLVQRVVDVVLYREAAHHVARVKLRRR